LGDLPTFVNLAPTDLALALFVFDGLAWAEEPLLLEELAFALIPDTGFFLTAGAGFGLAIGVFLAFDGVGFVFFFVMMRICTEYFFNRAWQELQHNGVKLFPIARSPPI
jgi:hypothetical protein